jgi:hypothetical protein
VNLDPEQLAPSLVGTGAQAIQDNAKRLGLTWTLRPGTVQAYSGDSGQVSIIFDGDTTAIGAVSLAGILIPAQRVMGMIIPPGGNFIIGGLEPFAPHITNVYGQAPVTTTVSGAFVNIGTVSPVQFTYTKYSDHTDILISAHIQFFVGVSAGTQAVFALTNGTQIAEIGRMQTNVINSHTQTSNVSRLTGMSAGIHTINLQWARLAGVGTLAMTAEDTISVSMQEIYPV